MKFFATSTTYAICEVVSEKCHGEEQYFISPYLEAKTDPESRSIVRRVLRLEDISRDNTAEGTSHDHEGHGESLLVLADHIIVLVGPLSGNVAGNAHDAEEHSAVAGMNVRGKPGQGDSQNVEERVED